jgi:lipopolysaccharide transport system permease protein
MSISPQQTGIATTSVTEAVRPAGLGRKPEVARESDHTVVLEPGHVERNYWRDFWRYRELLAILAWRDLAIRHKQTVLGIGWSIMRPLVTVLIFTFVFSRVAKLPSDGAAPYALMVFAGLLPWTLVTSIIGQTSGNVLNNAALIAKVYFPRLILPAVTVAVSLVDTAISFVLLLGMIIVSGFWPDWHILFVPAFLALAVLASIGPALALTALNIKYRDVQHIAGFALQFGLYISPVGFSSANIPAQWRLLYSLNPAVGIIDGFRWSLFRGEAQLYLPGLVFSLVSTAVVLWLGIVMFRKAERTFVDII